MATLDGGRITIAAQACGIAQAALDLAIEYAGTRIAFGGPIARFQGIQFPLADVAAKLDAARLLTRHAAALRDAGEPHGLAGAKAKLFASAVAVEAADMAVQTLGGYGYSAEFPGRALLPGRQDHRDLRGHEPDPTPGDRARTVGRQRALTSVPPGPANQGVPR